MKLKLARIALYCRQKRNERQKTSLRAFRNLSRSTHTMACLVSLHLKASLLMSSCLW